MQSNKIQVKSFSIEGKGVFATRDFAKGQMVCFFSGKKIGIAALKKNYAKKTIRIDDPFQVSGRTYLLLDKPFAFMNHSCAPNGGFRGKTRLVALPDIHAGDEITFDYSLTEWSDDKAWGIDWLNEWHFECSCSAKTCRKIVRMFPFLPAKTREKYDRWGLVRKDIRTKWHQSLAEPPVGSPGRRKVKSPFRQAD